MASSEEKIDVLHSSKSSKSGRGYQVWTHPPNLLGFTIY